MTRTKQSLNDSLEIFIDELMSDDELRDAFLREPEQMLSRADDWALPLSDSELQSLRTPPYALWDRVTEELQARYRAAA